MGRRAPVVVLALAGLAACARSIPAPRVSPSSPLAQLRIGMSLREVKTLVGEPSDEHHYATGKVAIPFYFGNDAAEIVLHYRGIGRVVLALGVINQNPAVIRVEEDRGESGFYRQVR